MTRNKGKREKNPWKKIANIQFEYVDYTEKVSV